MGIAWREYAYLISTKEFITCDLAYAFSDAITCLQEAVTVPMVVELFQLFCDDTDLVTNLVTKQKRLT